MVKSRFSRSLVALICVLVCLLFTACSEGSVVPYEIPETLEQVSSGVVAQNDRYELEWDEEVGCVLMRDKITGHVWGTTPYDFYQTGEYDVDMLSALVIEYLDPADTSMQLAYSYDVVEMLQTSSAKGENGVRVTYYFDLPQITVTLNYTLQKDSLKVTLNAADIVESGSTRLIQVSLTPYMASAPNDETKTDYLFVPAGSGALMYTDPVLVGTPRVYEGEVYGKDLTRFVLDNIGDEEPIRLPRRAKTPSPVSSPRVRVPQSSRLPPATSPRCTPMPTRCLTCVTTPISSGPPAPTRVLSRRRIPF